MKLSREWLSDYVKIEASDKEYEARMTMSGSKVEGVEVTGAEISGVVAGFVKEIKRHENSDHLWVCDIDVGNGNNVTIVTGAQNVKKGDMVPAALDGSSLPGGVKIKTGKLRGVESQGMLCSLKELGLDLHDFPNAGEDGIFILDLPCSPGDDIKDVLMLGDSVVDFEITNNRPDCLSVRGLARESAATFKKELNLPAPSVKGSGGDISSFLEIEIADAGLCPRYTARMVKNIKIEPSPYWMRRRLRASGVRPINNIVDITNYVMLEYGQPMHAFDYACVRGGKIIVRKAAGGETLETLDGNARKLSGDMLVIADTVGPVGIAGVMGGGNSEITDKTTTIVFESANFNGTSIRRTGIALGMRTDASSRFEKGLDPNGTIPAVERACELIEMLGAGEVVGGMIDVLASEKQPVRLKLETERINALLGTDIPEGFMLDTLERLGFAIERDGMEVWLTAPSWRSDIEHYADIAEEVARFYGYDVIEPTLFRGETAEGRYSDKQRLELDTGALCCALGFYEIQTYSFTGPWVWDKLSLPENSPLRKAFTILNPLGEDSSVMRTSALPSMLEALSRNFAARNKDAALYELGKVYLPVEGEELADERTTLTLGAYGGLSDFFAFKGRVEALLGALRVAESRFERERENPSYHPGRCARVIAGGAVIGVMGQIHPGVSEAFDIGEAVCCLELDVAALAKARSKEPSFEPLPKFPAITRDIALVCDVDLPSSALCDCINRAGGELLRQARVFDVYVGSHIPEGKKSVAFSLTLRSDSATLTDEMADKLLEKVLKALEAEYSAVIR